MFSEVAAGTSKPAQGGGGAGPARHPLPPQGTPPSPYPIAFSPAPVAFSPSPIAFSPSRLP